MAVDADQGATVSGPVFKPERSLCASVDIDPCAHLDVIRENSLVARERYADLLERLGR